MTYEDIRFSFVFYLGYVGICGVRWGGVIWASSDRFREEGGVCINWHGTDVQPSGKKIKCLHSFEIIF